MNTNLRMILILTVITLVIWGLFQIFKITSAPIPAPTQDQIKSLDPTIDKKVFEDIKNAPK